MKYFSTFSGIGGFEAGIQQAYEDNQNREQESIGERPKRNNIQQSGDSTNASISREESESEQGCRVGEWVCIGFSEIDKYASAIYQKHFPEHKPYGDITKINADALPDFDLLVGGFPCQAFSIAGKRKGFEDTRGTLFFDLARILRAKRPRLFVFENVKGLLSHDEGRTFRTIIGAIDELGYDLQWQVLNSKNFGVPQNRERVFIVGHLRGTSRPKVFPIAGNGEVYPDSSNDRQGQKGYSGALRAASQIRGSGDTLIAGSKIRRLTPTECERLQGFPDGWTEGVSDTQRYKCLGNAVTVNVIKAIVERLC